MTLELSREDEDDLAARLLDDSDLNAVGQVDPERVGDGCGRVSAEAGTKRRIA